MKAHSLEFRLRSFILSVILILGFTAPWNRWLHIDSSGPNAHVWGTLAAYLAMIKPGALSITAAFNLLLVVGILCALAAALLRTWGSAYLGVNVVKARTFQGHGVVAAGPYRYLRNPLYLGIIIHLFALALLMPPSGAIFCILAVGFFLLRLILGEEAFLAGKLGEPYLAYCARVPRLLPALTPRVPASTIQPAWATAFLGEIYMWGVAIAFIAVGYRYNAILITQGVIISLGVSMIARALIPKSSPPKMLTPIDTD